MSGFWSGWVMFLVVLNLGISLFLFVWGQRVEIPTLEDGTSGHAWAHGVLREGVRRLPTWWVVFSSAMFVGAFGYLLLYPGFGSFTGLLGWSSEEKWERETAANNAKLEPVLQSLLAINLEETRPRDAAAVIGGRLYQDNCAACHGSAAAGNQALGAPSLTDADWVYGGDPETVQKSILDGRHGVMPPWGAALGPEGVVDLVAYVMSLSGREMPTTWVEAGRARYASMCVACHGMDGRGVPQLGAPNLTDNVWLYGGDFASIATSIRDGRSGVMPAWRGRLSEEEARAITAWLYANSVRERR